MDIIQLSGAEQARTGFTHKFTIGYADLTTAGAAHTVALLTLANGQGIRGGAFRLASGWVGASVTNVTIKIGWDAATGSDDDDGLLEAVELATAGTEILAGDFTGAAFATKRTGYFAVEAATINAIFTATGANINVCTAGQVEVFLSVVDLTKV